MHHHHQPHLQDHEPGTRRRRAAFAEWGDGFDLGRGRGRGGPRGRGGRGRARRGDVRAALLALLIERPMHGYEIIQELSERTMGMWQPSPGSVYPTLQLLEDEGLITGEEADGKRRFTLTDAGREAVAARQGLTPWDHITKGLDPGVMDLRHAMAAWIMAIKQISTVGTDDQRDRAVKLLNEGRRQLYAILAEDTPPTDRADVPPDAS